jgi:hypothetical protein
MQVYVLLYNVGTENEGVHILRIQDHDIVLMFEDEDDATRYALLLEAQDFASPSVESFDQAEMEDICADFGYVPQLVPAGFVPQSEADRLLIAPPETNLDTTWKADAAPAQNEDEEKASIASDELDSIRRRLEGLL